MTGCVYAIMNTKTGRAYIGATVNLKARIACHMSALRSKDWSTMKGANQTLLLDYKKHGEDAFKVHVLEYVSDPDHRAAREQHWINRFTRIAGVYNVQRATIAAFEGHTRSMATSLFKDATPEEMEAYRVQRLAEMNTPAELAKAFRYFQAQERRKLDLWLKNRHLLNGVQHEHA